MVPQPSALPKLTFGPYEFDPILTELRKHGYKMKLPTQPGQVLVALLKRPGEPVTREELCHRLWPGVSSGDFEHGLNVAVNKLREVLGDTVSQPRYIETLTGRGYRFVAPVSPVSGGILELVPAPATPVSAPRSSPRVPIIWAGAVALLLLLGVIAWTARQSLPAPVKPSRFLVVPPKGYYFEGGGVRQAFALSPDGERIAFTAKDTSGAFRLFLRDFSQPECHPIADGEGAYSVVWTPDGRTLLFTAKGKLRRIEVTAAISQVISDASRYFSSAIPFGSDRLLVSNHRKSVVIPSLGGPQYPIDRAYSWAQSLPGGRDFLYTIYDPQLGSMRATSPQRAVTSKVSR